MKFLANENIEKRIVDFLRDSGYDVVYCAEVRPRDDDESIVKIANKEQRIILTNDKDFGELTYVKRQTRFGVILLRFEIERTGHKIGIIKKVLEGYKEKLPSHFVVLSEGKVRIRPI